MSEQRMYLREAGTPAGQELLHRGLDWSRCFHESLPVGVYETSSDGVIGYANKAMHELLGVSDAERGLLGRKAADFYPGDRSAHLANTRNQHWVSPDDVRLVREDGVAIWVRDYFRVVQDEADNVSAYQGVLVPIDDLKETQQQLELGERKLDFIGRTSSDLITLLTFSESPKYVYASPSHEQIVGYTARELLERSPSDLVHPEDLAPLLSLYEKFVTRRIDTSGRRTPAAEPIAEVRFRFLTSAGQWHWIESAVTFVRGMMMFVSRDLTHSQELNRKLRHIETYVHPMLDTTMSSILSCSPSGHIADRRFSKSLETLIGSASLSKCTCLTDLSRILGLPELLDVFDEVLQSTDVVETELAATICGTKAWFHLRAQQLDEDVDLDLEPLIVILLADISGARESQRRLAESESRFQELFDCVGSIIYVRDFDGTILAANPMFCKVFEFDQDQIAGVNIREIMAPEFVRSREELEALYASPSVTRGDGDVLAHSRSGKEVWLENQFRVRLRGDEPVLEVVGHVVTERKAQEAARLTGIKELERTLDGTVSALTAIVERRDSYTAGHQEHVAEIACAIGSAMEYSDDRLRGLRMAAMLHDIGKMSIPTDILVKPTRLNAAEMDLVRQHAIIGYEILQGIEFAWPIAEIVRQHHERLDGSGYPDGIHEADILEEARIIAVADVVEAMSAHRPYRPALGPESAIEEICRGAGTRYDASVVNVFRVLFETGVIGLTGGVLTRLNPDEIQRG